MSARLTTSDIPQTSSTPTAAGALTFKNSRDFIAISKYVFDHHSSFIHVNHVCCTQDWYGIFRRFDRDNSGLIDRLELSNALQGFGFSLPPELVAKLVKRFTPPPALGQTVAARPGISFDRFLLACVTVKHYTEAFRRWVFLLLDLVWDGSWRGYNRLDSENTGFITVAYNDYVSWDQWPIVFTCWLLLFIRIDGYRPRCTQLNTFQSISFCTFSPISHRTRYHYYPPSYHVMSTTVFIWLKGRKNPTLHC